MLTIGPTNLCGTCTLCCKVLEIEELNKPVGRWCDHCEPATGCRIYASRPESCGAFECVWLQSQKQDTPFPADLRPDRCRAVLVPSVDGQTLIVHQDSSRPDAFRQGHLRHVIDSFVQARKAVVIVTGDKRKLLTLREVAP